MTIPVASSIYQSLYGDDLPSVLDNQLQVVLHSKVNCSLYILCCTGIDTDDGYASLFTHACNRRVQVACSDGAVLEQERLPIRFLHGSGQ